jgi:hypothetical protein
MSRPDRLSQIAIDLREEIVDALADTVTEVIGRLSPAARLRLVAFLHLIEHPETVLADLNMDASGLLRLTLSKLPDPNQSH